MEKTIWVMGKKRQEMIEAQRRVNGAGSMRAVCILSFAALKKLVEGLPKNAPSLFILDYDMSLEEEFESLTYWKQQQELAGVPLFFMAVERNRMLDEECYSKGATVVLHKPFSRSGILRIERTAWQYEVTKKYEKMLQKQASDLQAAREIFRLNQQLKARNELLHQIFGRYFSDDVVEVILEQPQGAAIGGEKRELTIMMADLRGFTSLSANLAPDAVTQLLNLFFDSVVGAIMKYHGTVIEFLGDAVLAVFGAPIATSCHTEDAIAAAITMQNGMQAVNLCCKQNGYPELEMGIGIHRGEAFIGNVGSEQMMRYNVIGQVVNECSRIEGYSVGGQILLSQEAYEASTCPVAVAKRMNIRVKGLQQSVSVCDVQGIGGTYQCHLVKGESEKTLPVSQKIRFQLYPMEQKRILGTCVQAELLQCSSKCAVVKVLQLPEKVIELYTDVEVTVYNEKEELLFDGIYAKLTEQKGEELFLHFTHTNTEFVTFIEQIQEREEKE